VQIPGMVTGNLIIRGNAVVSGMILGLAYVQGLGQLTIQDGARCTIATKD
jgi:hypothetical protein